LKLQTGTFVSKNVLPHSHSGKMLCQRQNPNLETKADNVPNGVVYQNFRGSNKLLLSIRRTSGSKNPKYFEKNPLSPCVLKMWAWI